jgi:hypothetical protein
MSNTILLKRSNVANAVPTTANVAIGELAINTRDGKLYTKIRPDGVTDEIFELTQNQLITLGGDVTGSGISNISVSLNAAQPNITSVGNLTGLTLTGAINGTSVSLSGNLVSAGNITGEYLIANNAIVGNVTFSDISTGNITATGFANITGNVTGGNLITVGNVDATGNVAGNYFIGNGRFLSGIDTTLISNGATEVRTYENGNVAFTINGVANVVLVTPDGITVVGNANSGNVNTTAVFATTANITGNVNSGNVNTGFASITGNIDVGNITVNSGNITGANVISANTFTALANISAAGQITATGNVTGGNIVTTGETSTNTLIVSGNANVGNLSTAGTVTATGNITGGNIITVGEVLSSTLRTTGDALINGNLTVQGNLKYINVEDLRIEDPVIIMGTGPNGAPLTTNDGLDRGIYMEYYTTGLGNAFVGWQNLTGNLILATDVEFVSNDVVQVNSYGTMQAGNAYLESAVVVGNIAGGNITTAGEFSATGNIAGGNLTTAGQVTATGNITGGNIITVGNASITGNAAVGGILTDNYYYANGAPVDFEQPAGANTEIQFNLDGDFGASSKFTFNQDTDVLTVIGNIEAANMGATTVTTTGNITGANLNTAGKVTATGNVAGGNINTSGQVVAGANITGANIVTAGQVTATGTVTGGNLITSGNGNIATLTVSTFANVTATTASTSNITGALRVAGGVGIVGNVYAADMYSNDELVLTVESTIDGGTY